MLFFFFRKEQAHQRRDDGFSSPGRCCGSFHSPQEAAENIPYQSHLTHTTQPSPWQDQILLLWEWNAMASNALMYGPQRQRGGMTKNFGDGIQPKAAPPHSPTSQSPLRPSPIINIIVNSEFYFITSPASFNEVNIFSLQSSMHWGKAPNNFAYALPGGQKKQSTLK